MIKNGKYIILPNGDNRDFKELFRDLVSAGAGRSVDENGFAQGPWTADLLADAISQLDANSAGVDLRTVQFWFQENDKGISADNIRWLARVFGCGDPEATSLWQIELSAAHRRLVSKRKAKKRAAEKDEKDTSSDELKINGRYSRHILRISEGLFCGRSSLNLAVAVWAGCGTLWFLAFIFGVHDVTYVTDGINKQVGFFWSPAWNLGEMIFLPVFLILVSELLRYWKSDARSRVSQLGPGDYVDEGWNLKIGSYTTSYWVIFGVCFGLIFLLQWIGVYLLPLIHHDTEVRMVDWLLVAIPRPDVLSTSEAIFLSMIAFLYSGMIYWFYFLGLLFCYVVVNDFNDICRKKERSYKAESEAVIYEVSMHILKAIYSCAIFGSFVAICIKLNAAYLVSDSSDITSWLVLDMLSAIGMHDTHWNWLHGSPSPFFTSFLLLFLTSFVFLICSLQIIMILDHNLVENKLKRQARIVWLQMFSVIMFLGITFLLIGQFVGFSIVLFLGVAIAVLSLTWNLFMTTREVR